MLRFPIPLMSAAGALALTAAMTAPATIAASASASPAAEPPATGIGWSGVLPVPGSDTGLAPAVTAVDFQVRKADPVVLWASAGARISYAVAINQNAGRWTRPAVVDGGQAHTDQHPAATPFGGNPAGRVIVVWKQSLGRQLRYSVGSTSQGGVLHWADSGRPLAVPSAVTTSGPAVYSPQHSQLVVVAWRAAASNAVDVIVGVPLQSGSVRWGAVASIAGAQASGSPAITEVNGPGTGGRLYVLWRSAGNSGRIVTSFTADPLTLQPTWSRPLMLGPAVSTAAAPTAQAIGPGGTFPLLLVYLAAKGTTLSYVMLSAQGTTSRPLRIPGLMSADAPALSGDILAATFPAQAGKGRPGKHPVEYIRICPGC